MSGSDTEVQRLWQAINALGINVAGLTAAITSNSTLLTEVRTDVKGIVANGCSKAATHESANDDHEKRIRDLENDRNKAVGAGAVLGGIVGAALTALGEFLMHKIGG